MPGSLSMPLPSSNGARATLGLPLAMPVAAQTAVHHPVEMAEGLVRVAQPLACAIAQLQLAPRSLASRSARRWQRTDSGARNGRRRSASRPSPGRCRRRTSCESCWRPAMSAAATPAASSPPTARYGPGPSVRAATTPTTSVSQQRYARQLRAAAPGSAASPQCGPMSALTSETHGIASGPPAAAPKPHRRSSYANAAFTAALICSSVNGLVSTLATLGLEMIGAAQLVDEARHEQHAQRRGLGQPLLGERDAVEPRHLHVA